MNESLDLLDPAVHHDEVCRAVEMDWRRVARHEYRLCLGLHRLMRDNVHRGRGFSRFGDYTRVVFGIPDSLGYVLAEVGRHIARLPRVRYAMRNGELSYTQVREFMTLATEENEEEWIEFARNHTNREIEYEATRRRQKDEGSDGPTLERVTIKVTPDQRQEARKAQEDLMKETGELVSEGEMLGRMIGNARPCEELLPEGDDEPPPPPPKPSFYVALGLCPSCLDSWIPVPGANLKKRAEEWLRALREGGELVSLFPEQLCDCEEDKHRRDACPHAHDPDEPLPEGVSRYLPALDRRLIEARDGFRCRVPGCTNSVPLEGSHLHPHRDGHPTCASNVVLHCAAHNRMIESGSLIVLGHAPYEHYLHWNGESWAYLGVGYDPAPRRVVLPHVVESVGNPLGKEPHPRATPRADGNRPQKPGDPPRKRSA